MSNDTETVMSMFNEALKEAADGMIKNLSSYNKRDVSPVMHGV